MPIFQNHICFVSDQNIPEVLGALTPACDCFHIHALVTPVMVKKAKDFEKTCRKLGFRYSAYSVSRPDRMETSQLLDQIFLCHPGESFAVNISGGNKLMSIAAYDWCNKKGLPSLYVDSLTAQIHLHEDGIWKIVPIPEMLKIKALLYLYGHEIIGRKTEKVEEKIRMAINRFINFLEQPEAETTINSLNHLSITAASHPPFTVPISALDSKLETILAICQDAGKLTYDRNTIRFVNKDSCNWCNGLWLEDYVQLILESLLADKLICSYACSVHTSSGNVTNELDAVFSARNRLFVIECKTGSMKKPTSVSIIYKADSLREKLAGIYTKFMICAIDPLAPTHRKRAKQLNIKVVESVALKKLRSIIIDWINTA